MALLETLTDDFPGTTLNAQWQAFVDPSGGGSSLNVSGGTLNLIGNNSSYSYVNSVSFFDLMESYLLAKVDLGTSNAGLVMLVAASSNNSIRVEFELSNVSTCTLRFYSGGVLTAQTLAYSAATMAWWRIRHTAGKLYWDTSPDGLVWTQRHQYSYSTSTTTFQARLFVQGASSSNIQPVKFDKVNLAPVLSLGPVAPNGIADAEGFPYNTRLAQSKFETLKDSFPGTTLDTTKWKTNGIGTCTVSGGTLNIAMGSTINVGTVTTYGAFYLTNSYFLCKLSTNASTNHQVDLQITGMPGTSESFTFMNGGSSTLYLRGYNAAGAVIVDVQPAYSATNHAWLRLRHTGTVLYWETSPDGGVWTIQAQATYTPTAPSFTAQINANQYSTGTGLTVTVDNVNLGLEKLETLTDHFTTGPLDPVKWTATTNPGYVAVSGGTLNINTPAGLANGAPSNVVIRSTDSFILANSYLLAKVALSGSDIQQFTLKVRNLTTGESFHLQCYAGTLNARLFNGSTNVFNNNAVFDQTAMLWWRIRYASAIYLETSPDSVTWTVRGNAAYTLKAGAYLVEFESTWGGTTTATTMSVDNVNLIAMGVSPNSLADSNTLGSPALTFVAAKLETLTDDFGGSSLDAAKWTVNTHPGLVAVSGGTLNINTTAGLSTGASGVLIRSANSYTVASSYVLANVTLSTSNVQAFNFGVRNLTTGEFFSFEKYGPNIRFRIFDGSTYLADVSRTYDPVTMAWWRIRHQPSSVFLETSPDSVTWTTRGSSPLTLGAGYCVVEFESAWGSTSTATTISVDNVNLVALPGANPNSAADPETLGAPDAAFVYAATVAPAGVVDPETLDLPSLVLPPPPKLLQEFTDYFPGPTLDPTKWTTSGATSTFDVDGGTLNINSGASTIGVATAVGSYTFANSHAYAKVSSASLTGHMLTMRVEPVAGGNERFYFQLNGNTNNFQCLGFDVDGNLYVNISLTYNATNHAYWRIRHGNNTVYWETSTNGTTWTGRAEYPFTLSQTLYRLAFEGRSLTATPKTARYDNVNVIPKEPNSVADAETFGDPALSFAVAAPPIAPASLADPETLGAPAVDFAVDTSPHPDSLADPETLDSPDLGFIPAPATPDTIVDGETLTGPTAYIQPTLLPAGIAELETFDEPVLSGTVNVAPGPIVDAGVPAEPYVGFQASTVTAPTLADPETLGAPSVQFFPGVIGPQGISDAQAVGQPELTYISVYSGAYNTGDYGRGPYQGMFFSPDGIIDRQAFADPDIWVVPPIPTNMVLPLGIVDDEQFGLPQAPNTDATNYTYGTGTYNYGPYSGNPGTPTDTNPSDNPSYSFGTYGYGKYYGVAEPAPPEDSLPIFASISGRIAPPMHIIGVGPWSSRIIWRGAPNYNIDPGTYPSRPALALPPATSKGFTLRLNEGGEARIDMAFTRDSTILLDEMDTDLWWRRKDPRTKQLEMIGRFNVAHLSVAASDTGVTCSAQLVDYRTILADRMIMRYLHPYLPVPTTMWDVGTPVMEIIQWIVPANLGLDLTEIDTYDLGKTTGPFQLPLGTLLSDAFDNLEAHSPHRWEWWIETPLDIHQAPKLMFFIGERGEDKGVVLFDHGKGPTPIAAWTRNGASDDYANSLYYTGDTSTGSGADAAGGVVVRLDTDINQYGQRDQQDGTSSIGGDINSIRQRANRKLQKLSDRRPSYEVTLKQGFWRGRHHIDVGDTITLILRLGKDLLNDKYRVSQITVDIDENDEEHVSMSLGRLPTSADPRSKRAPIPRLIRYLKNYNAPPRSGDVPPPDD